MSAHRIETTVATDGTLTLTNLPFRAGDTVEVLILPRPQKLRGPERYPLHGKPIQYVNPTDPVAEEEWAALP
jgi:hypothetical protein